MADYDEREEELSSIAAIFPELVLDVNNPFAARIELPVAPSAPLTVRFPAELPPSPPSSENSSTVHAAPVQSLQDTHKLDHLPALHLGVVLPTGYPADEAPQVSLSTTPDWLPKEKLKELSDDVDKLWEEYGRCQILFSYIDHLQQAAERAFGLSDCGLDLPPDLKPVLIAFDATTRKAVFDAQTFDCGVCLEPKKGSECYRLQRCSHVFCRECLQDTYNNYIKEGDVIHVRCLDPTCGKSPNAVAEGVLRRKRKSDRTLHPRELLDMGLDEAVVRRYVEMKRKKTLEADKSTIYCPRSWCQAPARSAKYPPLPADLRQYPESESEESDTETTPGTTSQKNAERQPTDRLCICSKCTLAFCRVCYSGWHGDFAPCWPRNPSELSEEEKASYDYIRLHTSPCPTCNSPVQKTMGCNHMTCFQCQSHFCYLCSAWLDSGNPYQHFNKAGTGCYQRLWELEEGDEGQNAHFGGQRMWEEEARRVAEEADRAEAERLQAEENEGAVLHDPDPDHQPMIRLNGGQLLPEAPAPPPVQLEAGLAAQMARLQVQPPAEQRAAHQQPRRRNHHLPPQQEHFRGRGRGNGQGHGQNARGDRGRGRGRGRGRAAERPAARDDIQNGFELDGAARAGGPVQPPPPPLDDAAAAAAFRHFLELAARDQEEEWDSDELDDADDARWEIRPRDGNHGPR